METLLYFVATPGSVRPVVELADSPSTCFASLEVQGVAFIAGTRGALVHPADHAFASYITVGTNQHVRLSIARRENSDETCRVRSQLLDERGKVLSALADVVLAPGKTAFMEASADRIGLGPDPGRTSRVVADLEPVEPNSAEGCLVALSAIAPTGETARVVPLAVRRLPELPAAPPSRTRTGAYRATSSSSTPTAPTFTLSPPLGLPSIDVPADNPMTAETVALGRRLFYDTRLSRDGTVSCASCHDPSAGFRDFRRVSQGVNGLDGTRQSMTILNVAVVKDLFWDGRANSLEEQAKGPVDNPVEFAFSHRGVEHRLRLDKDYVQQFAAAFGPGEITYDKAAKALAAFQRTVLSANSPFDRFTFGRDQSALTPSAQRGLNNGLVGSRCTLCHTVGGSNATFADIKFHNTGVAALSFDKLSDQGRWTVTGDEKDHGAFRPTSLRNIVLFPRLMHNGRISV